MRKTNQTKTLLRQILIILKDTINWLGEFFWFTLAVKRYLCKTFDEVSFFDTQQFLFHGVDFVHPVYLSSGQCSRWQNKLAGL